MSNTSCWRFLLVVIAVTIATLLCPALSMAATIFSQTGTADGSYTETSTEYWSQSFTLGGSSMALTTVDVFLNGGGPLGQFFVDLYSDNGGTPGTFIESLSGNNDPQTAGTYTFTSTGSLLFANTTYWIVQGISSGNGFTYWNEENNNSPEVGSSIGAEFSTNSGGTWNLQTSHSLQMVVNGTVAVPEPSTIWAILLGGSGLTLLSWRRLIRGAHAPRVPRQSGWEQ